MEQIIFMHKWKTNENVLPSLSCESTAMHAQQLLYDTLYCVVWTFLALYLRLSWVAWPTDGYKLALLLVWHVCCKSLSVWHCWLVPFENSTKQFGLHHIQLAEDHSQYKRFTSSMYIWSVIFWLILVDDIFLLSGSVAQVKGTGSKSQPVPMIKSLML